jgi:nucleotide-binding universal stress UspA family protein
MFQRILYPIDVQEGDVCRRCLETALEEARTREAQLYLMYVVPGFGMPLVAAYFPKNVEQAILDDAREAMDRYVEEHVPADLEATALVRQGKPYEQIIEAARELDIDLIVIPSHDRSQVERWLLGSTTSKVVHHAPCAVMVLREEPGAD